jgi:hypothetical protein
MNLSFLFTTSRTFSLYENGKITDIYKDNNSNRIYGITWNEKIIYIAAYDSKIKKDVIKIFDKKFNYIKDLKLKHKLLSTHQIYYYNNHLYIMNTDSNFIDILNTKDNSWRRKKWRDTAANKHINSIWCDGKSFYVCEHNGLKPPSCIQKMNMNLENEKLYGNMGKCIHNVYIEDGIIFTCDSAHFTFARFNLKGKRMENKQFDVFDTKEWFNRGLCRNKNKNFWMIGLSCHRKYRKDRKDTKKGGVLILNNKFDIIEKIPINNYGQINEIRLISELDLAHNSIPF